MAKKLKKSTRYSRMRGPSTCIVLGAYRIVTCIIGLARAYSRLVIVFYFGKGFTVFGFLCLLSAESTARVETDHFAQCAERQVLRTHSHSIWWLATIIRIFLSL